MLIYFIPFAIKSSITVMDLGKMLLQYCREGETSKVHDLMCRGAPFSTDWVSKFLFFFPLK